MSQNLKIKLQKRKGFTLLEVLFASVALATVATILFSVTTSAHLTTLNITRKRVAQNIAQATLEDIMAQNNFYLDELIKGDPSSISSCPMASTVGGTADGTIYQVVNIDSLILLDEVTTGLPPGSLAAAPPVLTNDGAKISLFDYTTNPFFRNITITDKKTTPKSYSIDIIVFWSLNSTELNPQPKLNPNIEITGTKN